LLLFEGKLPEALVAYGEAQQALDGFEEGTDARLVRLEIAEAHRGAKDLAAAWTAVEGAIAESNRTTDRFTAYKAEALAARIAKEQGAMQKAIDLARGSLAVSDEVGDTRGSAETRALLAGLERTAAPR
jgi:hypothetical protein